MSENNHLIKSLKYDSVYFVDIVYYLKNVFSIQDEKMQTNVLKK